jgi:hypothetical protein
MPSLATTTLERRGRVKRILRFRGGYAMSEYDTAEAEEILLGGLRKLQPDLPRVSGRDPTHEDALDVVKALRHALLKARYDLKDEADGGIAVKGQDIAVKVSCLGTGIVWERQLSRAASPEPPRRVEGIYWDGARLRFVGTCTFGTPRNAVAVAAEEVVRALGLGVSRT